MTHACSLFQNQPLNGYRPLACKRDVITTRDIGGTGAANKQEFFFLTKPNTIRERATIDLLYPTPSWLVTALQKTSLIFVRATINGQARVTTDGFLRVTAE